jgi:predicted kinase
LAERAALIVRGGHDAIVDAVYARPADRRAIEQVAAAAAVPFIGLWLEAPESVLIARTERRTNDPSDADANVIHLQTSQDTGDITWSRLDASVSEAALLSSAASRVGERLPDALSVVGDEGS